MRYPNGLAWQLNVPKKALRRSPEFKKFHSFLVFETDVVFLAVWSLQTSSLDTFCQGNITRQEAVSMLPPLFLDVEPHHVVLDMCAAPGSKVRFIWLVAINLPVYNTHTHAQTSQLLESLHSSQSLLESSIPRGLLIANDNDYKRTHVLIHQTARLPSPAFVVTNVDASIFPTLSLPPENTAESSGRNSRHLLFDRILCDVPCSGDGTIRKNVGIWKKWNAMDGNGLHSYVSISTHCTGKPRHCPTRLQFRILQRAMRMLRRGGKIVYSTCSLNPVENEAVVAEALRTVSGMLSTVFIASISHVYLGFELVEVSECLPSLIRRPGLTKWLPTVDRDLKYFETYDDYTASLPGGKRAARLARSHWPPAEDLGLKRWCVHSVGIGSFFFWLLI
jgi:multisite-specific tRNA:(cytosine-C5)-methyltransferase